MSVWNFEVKYLFVIICKSGKSSTKEHFNQILKCTVSMELPIRNVTAIKKRIPFISKNLNEYILGGFQSMEQTRSHVVT